MIIDGRALAEERVAELLKERSELGPLTLSIVVTQEDAVTSSFLRIKGKIAERLAVAVEYVSSFDAVRGDGIILQLPLQAGLDVDVERNKIPLLHDVDVLSNLAFEEFTRAEFPPPPVARAVDVVLVKSGISVSGKKVVVVGQGRLVGKPVAELMRQQGALVTVLEKGEAIEPHTKDADIIVLGAGVPGLLQPDMVRDGVVILDAGTSELSGKVVGDADPACAEKAALFTPTPGGIGPLAVVEIFANLFELVKRR